VLTIDDIKKFFRGRIALSEPLAKHTSFRIGGPADYYCEPEDKEDAVNIIAYLERQGVPFAIIGKGSNLLVSDEGIRGAVINLEPGLKSIRVEQDRVFADTGVSLSRFVEFCVQRNFKGVEMLAGIPGTIGGAVLMNASAYGGQISDYLVDVEMFRKGTVLFLKKEEVGFSYRHAGVREGDIVLGASFRLPAGDKAEIMKIRRELLLKRNRSQPVNFPSAGCMFKNPAGHYAAKLIEEAGLKGARSGQAQISEKHANFIVNLGSAHAKDVLALVDLAKKTVFEKFHVMLELEVKLVGFPPHEAERGAVKP
jgi:UDP-N-acetylmuramate dehydrogenase